MAPQIDINLSEGIWQRFQQTKYFVKDSVNSLTNSAQQAGNSFKETANQAGDKAINTVTKTWEQTKGSVEQSLQTAEQIKSTTSVAVQSAINSSMNDWLVQHPLFLKLIQILNWAANHPIISCVIFVFILAIVWSIIKAIMRLIEAASWSILQAPIKLLQALINVSFLSLRKFGSFVAQRMTGNQPSDEVSALLTESSPIPYQDKQQRLAEISHRLEAIQKEQHELLQEAADLIASGTIDNIKIEEITLNSHPNYTN
jgi:gas vesicle protein